VTRYSKISTETQPGSDPPAARDPQDAADDRATIRAIKGRGLVVSFSSHFAIAVVGAAIAAFYAGGRKGAPESDAAYQKAVACVERLDKLEAAVTQLRNESTMHNGQVDTQLSLLVIRTDILLRK